jgi:hypothetical protein
MHRLLHELDVFVWAGHRVAKNWMSEINKDDFIASCVFLHEVQFHDLHFCEQFYSLHISLL